MPVTSSAEFTVKQLAAPNLKITRLDYPPSARPGTIFIVEYAVHNYGGDTSYTQWCRIVDRDTGSEVIRNTIHLPPDGDYSDSFPLTMPNREWKLRFETGYGTTVTDYRDFTVTTAPPPDIKIENLSYPSTAKPGDPVTISWNACNRGGYTPYAWTRLIDKDTGEQLYIKRFDAPEGACASNSPTLTMPNRDWKLRIEAGYEETTTASSELQVSLPTPPVKWLPIAAPIIFGLAVIGASKLRKTK